MNGVKQSVLRARLLWQRLTGGFQNNISSNDHAGNKINQSAPWHIESLSNVKDQAVTVY